MLISDSVMFIIGSTVYDVTYLCPSSLQSSIEHSGSGVELRTLDYENPGANPVLRC